MNIKLSTKRGARGTFLFALALALTVFVAGCSKNANTGNSSNSSSSTANTSSTKPAGSSPTDALKAYYDAAKRKDMETAKRYLSRATVQMMEDIAKSQGKTLDQMMKEGADRDTQMPTPEFSNEKISGDTATVDIKAPNQPLVTAQMVKEDGDWKLAVDKMMGAMKPPAEEHREGGNESEKENENDHH